MRNIKKSLCFLNRFQVHVPIDSKILTVLYLKKTMKNDANCIKIVRFIHFRSSMLFEYPFYKMPIVFPTSGNLSHVFIRVILKIRRWILHTDVLHSSLRKARTFMKLQGLYKINKILIHHQYLERLIIRQLTHYSI